MQYEIWIKLGSLKMSETRPNQIHKLNKIWNFGFMKIGLSWPPYWPQSHTLNYDLWTPNVFLFIHLLYKTTYSYCWHNKQTPFLRYSWDTLVVKRRFTHWSLSNDHRKERKLIKWPLTTKNLDRVHVWSSKELSHMSGRRVW